MDIYVEMNQPTKGNHQYLYIDNYKTTPCVYSKYKGHSQNASMATREVNEYIKKNGFRRLKKLVKHINKEPFWLFSFIIGKEGDCDENIYTQ
jgi:hypothetical protein